MDDAFGELTYEDNDDDIDIENQQNIGEFDDANILDEDADGMPANVLEMGNNHKLPKGKQKKSKNKSRAKLPGKPPIVVTTREPKRGPPRATGRDFLTLGNPGPMDGEHKFESVFNTASPMDWHLRVGEEEFAAKRRRVEVEDAVGQATMRILAARMARFQSTASNSLEDPCSFGGGGQTMASRKQQQALDRERVKLRLMPPTDGQAWYGISAPDGSVRQYVAVKKRRWRNPNRPEDIGDGKEKNDADSEFFYDLLYRVEENGRRRKLQKEMEEREKNQANAHQIEEMDCEIVEVDEANANGEKAASRMASALWTDKYAPRSFLDLLSLNETNRLVLLWLRLWDSVVFRHRKRAGTALWDSLGEKDRALVEVEHRRGGQVLPKQKILVLYGSSGVGKSSLAVIAAKQAGYQPLVLSISEFQNVAELRNRLENKTTNTTIQTLFKQQLTVSEDGKAAAADEEKPVCFVIEGLEMANADMIQFLCNWARRSGAGASGGGNARRPIICTCANIWHGQALRELRTNALALRVQACGRDRLQRRLIEICQLEGVHVDKGQLSDLLQTHGSDIRLCLNTLQFVTANARNSNGSDGNGMMAKTGGIDAPQGGGDNFHQSANTAVAVSMLDVLSAIFTLDFHMDNRGIVRPPAQRVRSLLNLVGQLPAEDFGRLQQLVFTNFASVLKLSHAQCRRIARLFVHMDHTQSLINHGQHYALYRYLAHQLLVVHFVCAMHVSRRLQFNMSTQPFSEQLRENQQILRSMRAGAAAGHHYLGTGDLLLWLLDHLFCVLQPPIQPISAHLQHSGQQQLQLQRIVQLMHSFRLKYVLKYGPQAAGSKGNGTTAAAAAIIEARYCFEPPFDTLVCFPLSQQQQDRQSQHLLSESTKKFIAHQVELAAIHGHKLQHIQPNEAIEGNDAEEDVEMLLSASTQADNSNQQLPQATTQGQRPAPLAFPWLQQSSTNKNAAAGPVKSNSTTAAAAAGGSSVTFRYSTGSSQAVRRRILIGELFK